MNDFLNQLKNKKILYLFKCLGVATLIYMSFFTNIYGKTPNITLEKSLIFIGMVYFVYINLKKIKINKPIAILTMLFAFFTVLGRAYEAEDTYEVIFFSHRNCVTAALSLLGFFCIFYICLFNILLNINKLEKINEHSKIKKTNIRLMVLVIFLCWLPIIIIYLPGSVDYDSFRRLTFWTGEVPWSTHHPVLSTVYVGLVMDFAKYILHNVNIGAFIYVFVQVVLFLYAIALLIKLMNRLYTPNIIVYGVVIYYGLVPVWAGYVQCVVKDTLHFIFFTLYSIYLVEMILNPEWIKKPKNFLMLFFISTGLWAFRNTGIYLFLLSFIPFTLSQFKKKKLRKFYVLISLTVMLFYILFNSFLVPTLGIKSGGVNEMLSIPFQQTARYLKYYPNDISNSEKKIINNILPLDKISKVYNSQISDPVKNLMKNKSDANANSLILYFGAWLKMGMRHPGVYIDSFLCNTYDYFYPDGFSRARNQQIILYIMQKNVKNSPNTGRYDITYLLNSKIRNKVSNYIIKFFRKVPVLGLAYNTGMYTWICFICAFLLIYIKEYYSLFAILPSCCIFLFCIASPVNGYVRYAIPIMATIPLLISWVIYKYRLNTCK